MLDHLLAEFINVEVLSQIELRTLKMIEDIINFFFGCAHDFARNIIALMNIELDHVCVWTTPTALQFPSRIFDAPTLSKAIHLLCNVFTQDFVKSRPTFLFLVFCYFQLSVAGVFVHLVRKKIKIKISLVVFRH